jgi:hypothetical protein
LRHFADSVPPQDHVEDTFRLGLWVTNQRRRKALLPLQREQRLDAIGFIWDPQSDKWEQGFIALLNFKRREGHCRVPTIPCRRKVQTWKVGFDAAHKQEDNVCSTDDAILTTTTRRIRSLWCEVTAFSLTYREYPANYGIRTTSPLALNKAGLLERRLVHQFQMKGLAFCAIDSSEALSP